ncbi:aminotransferase class I/II-fold pyridoxal phosphate-dependent enzyme, partial [Vibrio parahaemolyticus]|nr:aminotransferase class I/II-fold pyridoxal phosphate-dependent enzyme [Vibrio parahaemolyticus]
VRCGIVIASEEITQALTNMNGIISLAPGSVGPALANHIIAKGDLLKLSSEVIKPFYKQKSQRAVELLQQAITDERFRIHKPEGAIFLWLWFDELPITTMELYQRLKARGVLIVPGEYFFIGQKDEWDHAHQCLRMNYVQDDEVMQKGIAIIAEEVEKAYLQSQ